MKERDREAFCQVKKRQKSTPCLTIANRTQHTYGPQSKSSWLTAKVQRKSPDIKT